MREKGRPDEALVHFANAAALARRAGDPADEGRHYQIAADTLIALGRDADAREALRRAAACKERVGPGAQPWNTHYLLSTVERRLGDTDAAAVAFERSVQSYLSR